jgi:hypothetical protein
LGFREIAAIVIVGALAAVALVTMKLPYNSSLSFGFGPEWDCSRAGQGEPICIRTRPDNPN